MIHTFYREGDSFLHSLDARTKIVAAIITTVVILLFNDPIVTGIIFLILVFLAAVLGGVRWGELWAFLKPLIPLLIFTVLIWVLIYTPRLKGLLIGISFGIRLLSLAIVSFILLATTRQRDIVQGFVRMGMPYEFGLTISIGLRYIPTLYTLSRNIMDAQRSRGWEVEKGNILVRIRKMSADLIPLLVASLKTAHELSIALESRAFGASKKRTFLNDLKREKRDYAILATSLVLLIVSLYLRYSLGFGHIILYE
jgi:energy-coupling factor transport system permease protein